MQIAIHFILHIFRLCWSGTMWIIFHILNFQSNMLLTTTQLKDILTEMLNNDNTILMPSEDFTIKSWKNQKEVIFRKCQSIEYKVGELKIIGSYRGDGLRKV